MRQKIKDFGRGVYKPFIFHLPGQNKREQSQEKRLVGEAEHLASLENEVPMTRQTLTGIEAVRDTQVSPSPHLPLVSQVEIITYFFQKTIESFLLTHSHVELPTFLV